MIIQSKNVYFNEKLQPLQVEFVDGKITKVMPYGTTSVDKDYGENWVLPGLIDVHNHGYLGGDANHATVEWVNKYASYLPSEGVTSWVPSTSAAPHETVLNGMKAIAQAVKEGVNGSNVIGIYSEGPFISEKCKGAQDFRFHLVPTREIIDEYLEASSGLLKYVMLAPEMLDDMDVITYCRSKGCAVSIGHSDATFEVCTKARNAGAVSFTHTYNGMRGLHHREAGTVGAAMYYKDMYAELIGDGVHVSFPACKILADAKGKDRLVSVTDSVGIKGLPVGEFVVEGQTRYICEDGVARLANGSIAGSANRLNWILYREINKAGIDYVTAINSCTANPAALMGVDNCKGYIKPGYDADIVVFDSDMEAIQTYVAGKEMLAK